MPPDGEGPDRPGGSTASSGPEDGGEPRAPGDDAGPDESLQRLTARAIPGEEPPLEPTAADPPGSIDSPGAGVAADAIAGRGNPPDQAEVSGASPNGQTRALPGVEDLLAAGESALDPDAPEEATSDLTLDPAAPEEEAPDLTLVPDAPGRPAGEAAERPPAPFAKPLPRIIAIANQKGGVGKTTTAVNLGAALAELGYRVLVIDLDPQANATTGLGLNPRSFESSVYDVILRDTPLEDCIEPTAVRNLFAVPATIDLAGAEIELVPAFSRELKLRRAVEQVIDDFDFVLIDCPPSLGLITVNGLAAATEVVVPIQCEYYALEGLGQLLRNVNLVHRQLNPRLELGAIILTMYDARTKLAEQVATEVRRHFGDKVCRNIVPRTVRLSEAPSFGQPIIVFDPTSRGALAYRELAKEVSGGAPQRVG